MAVAASRRLRVLEHDDDGGLVWRSVGLSVPRQQGKSTIVGELASWRLQSGDRFNGLQNVLLVARDVGAAVTVQKPHAASRGRPFPLQAVGRGWAPGDRVPEGRLRVADPLQ